MMKKRVAGTVVGLTLGLAVVLPGFTAVDGVGMATAQLQPVPSPVASPDVSPTPLPGRTTGAELRGTEALGNVVDSLIVNGPLFTHLTNRGGAQEVVSRAEVDRLRVVNLNNVLNRDELDAMIRLINNSRELRRAVTTTQRLVQNDAQVQSVLQRQNLRTNQVVALEVLGEPTLYVIAAAGAVPSPSPSPAIMGTPGTTTGISPSPSPAIMGTPAPAASPAAKPQG